MDFLNDIEWTTLLEENWPLFLDYGMRFLGALVLILVGLRVAGWLANIVRTQALNRDTIDDTLGNFFASIVRWFVTAGVFIAALQVFGVPATSLVAILGALTLAIGLSLQGALGNIASGVMIMLFRPYTLKDYVEIAGVSGSVRDINLFQTVLSTPDNVKIMVPNSQAIESVIKNYTGYPTRRIDLVFGIDYGDGMENAMNVIESVILADDRILKTPAPIVRVDNLGASSVDIIARPWVKATDYWEVRWDLTKRVKAALDEAGISIPYPHTVMVTKPG